MSRLFNPQKAVGYHAMVGLFHLMDLFRKPDGRLDAFTIESGMVVADYGCGPGRYIRKAAELVGPRGRVYAVDINPIGIAHVEKRVRKHQLENVVPIWVGDPRADIEDHCVDVVYALDMFHQISDPVRFLADVHRMTKRSGVFYLEDGHQPRDRTLSMIGRSDLWRLSEQTAKHVVLKAS